MTKRPKLMLVGAAIAAAAAGGAGIAIAGSGDDNEAPIRATDLDRASAAALQHTGGGEVTDTEVGDEESRYEVEVTLDDGSQVDVQLDRGFDVAGDEPEGEDEPGDD